MTLFNFRLDFTHSWIAWFTMAIAVLSIPIQVLAFVELLSIELSEASVILLLVYVVGGVTGQLQVFTRTTEKRFGNMLEVGSLIGISFLLPYLAFFITREVSNLHVSLFIWLLFVFEWFLVLLVGQLPTYRLATLSRVTG